LLAMSKLDGKPLDQWLYGVDENRLKTLPMKELLDGPLPGGQLGTRDLAGASAASSALISQMATVLAALEPIAFHRDISAHNFLIRATPEGEEFSLLDFGLAVRSKRWPTDYKTKSICGDPRYFTPTAWMLMVYGHKYVNNYPDPSFLQQYMKRIDHFSFGVLALEVLFTLWHGPAAQGMKGDAHPMVQVWKAWRVFWTEAVSFFQKFHAKGAAATQQSLSRSGAIARYVQQLKVLCASLRTASASIWTTCQTAASVFKISADLLDPCGTLTWKSLPAQLPLVTQALAAKKRQQRRSVSVGGLASRRPIEARPWSGVVESSVGWIAMSLTRGMLDLAWTGACPPPKKTVLTSPASPPKKTVLTPRRQKATCFTSRGC
jgi:serine/threonine protein kinase